MKSASCKVLAVVSLLTGTPSLAVSPDDVPFQVSLGEAQYLGALFTQSAATSKIEFLVDDGLDVMLEMLNPDLTLQWSITAPDGSAIADSAVGNWNGSITVYNSAPPIDNLLAPLPLLPGTMGQSVIIRFQAPISGRYSMKIAADPFGIDGEQAVFVTARTNSPVKTTIMPFRQTYGLGSPIVAGVIGIKGNAPLTGATVTLQAISPSGIATPISVADDGTGPDGQAADGMYTGELPGSVVNESGSWSLAATITGTLPSGHDFQRASLSTVLVTEPCGALVNLNAMYGTGYDADGNGRYDGIRFFLQLNAAGAGAYLVRLMAQAPWDLDNDGQPDQVLVSGRVSVNAAGTSAISIDLPLKAEQIEHLDGSFIVKSAEITGEFAAAYTLCARYPNLNRAVGPFTRVGFDRWDTRWVPSQRHVEFLDDETDQDSLFDVLRLYSGVYVRYDGRYRYHAQLIDPCGKLVCTVVGEQQLLGGTLQNIIINFPGALIGLDGIDGVWSIRNVDLNGPMDVSNPGYGHMPNMGNWGEFKINNPVITTTQWVNWHPFQDLNNNGLPDFCEISSGQARDRNGDWIPDEVQCIKTCPADISSLGGVPKPDCQLTADDLVRYLSLFSAGVPAADLVSLGGSPPPDGVVTVDDLVYFIAVFSSGCEGFWPPSGGGSGTNMMMAGGGSQAPSAMGAGGSRSAAEIQNLLRQLPPGVLTGRIQQLIDAGLPVTPDALLAGLADFFNDVPAEPVPISPAMPAQPAAPESGGP